MVGKHSWDTGRIQEAELASVRPESFEDLLSEYEHGILSVAPSDEACAGEDLQRVRAWMEPRLRQGVVLLADTLDAAFLQIRHGLSADRAEGDADAALKAFLEREGPGFQGLGCRFQFARASALLEREDCKPFREGVRRSAMGESQPGEGLSAIAETWVAAISTPQTRLSPGLLRQLALEAMLDHLTVLAFLRSQGWSLHVHQGFSSVLRWINGDQAFELPEGLRRMVFVELGPRIWP